MPQQTRQAARDGAEATHPDADVPVLAGVPPLSFGVPRPARRPDRRAVHWWLTQNLLVVVPVLAALAAAALTPDAPSWLWAVFGVLCPVGAGYALLTPWYRYRVHRWEAGVDAVCATSGWLTREWRVVPFTRIQTLDTKRGPLMQLFGLSAVTVTTASAAGPVTLVGLDRHLAEELVRDLTERVRALREDGT
ncbi:PH domain-containing protein [Streptomyces flavofungini]|uniref:PH domain-containing protein n=1 Tax=Streptomyces flavofungini TaxID=68200 RepID=UPI0025AFA0B5|nr:PH domain-containing protein [Streptomyces flavofungini]WJV44893.1 PH domain-containing protein [Streptomyces flavofungini]